MIPGEKRPIQRIILVNPYYQKITRSIAQITIGPPLGLAYIAAVLEQNGYTVSIIDANAKRLSLKEITSHIMQLKADLIGLPAVTPTVHMCGQIAAEIKKLNNSVLTVIGGVHATALPEETLQEFTHFDFLIRGEGEFVFTELLNALNNNATLSSIKGLVYRDNGRIIMNEMRSSIEDLDRFPFPARHLLPNRLYRTFDSDRMTAIIAMRGCPAKCIYCAVNLVAGRKCRKRSPNNIIEEIKLCASEYGTRFVTFLDDTFTFDKSWAHNLCEEFIRTGLNKNIKWSCLTRVDNIDYDILRHMKQAGCIRVEFGIESGSQELLDYLKKEITTQQVRKAFLMAKKIGLSTMGFAMLNIPGETAETIAKTKRLIMEIEPDFLQLSFATPYPGTELFESCTKEGLLINRDWSKYIFLNYQLIKNNLITESELKKLMWDIQRSFYMRPKYIFRMLSYTLKNPAIIRTMLWAGLNALKKLFSRG